MQFPPSTLALPLALCLGCAATPPVVSDADPASLSEREALGFLAVENKTEAVAPPLVLVGATIMTAAGEIYDPGYIRLEEGRIAAVGGGQPDEVGGVHVIDVQGQYITPGLIDTHSHLGVYPSPGARAHRDGNEATEPVTAGVWAEHSFWPQDPGIERAVAGGVTTFQILPGSANLVGGRGVILRTIPALGARAMRFEGAPETVKMACGENPKRVYGERKKSPSTRMGNLRDLREALYAAGHYQAEWDAWERQVRGQVQGAADAGEGASTTGASKLPPKRDLDLETLAGVLRGEILVHTHCYRADDMLSMLQVAEEFGFKIESFHHALEAYKIREILAEAGTASSTWADWWGFKLEANDAIPQNAALLTQAGATAIIHSDSSIDIQRLNQEAAKALYSGRQAGIDVSDDQALRWITANPAHSLGIAGQTGSLEVGKRGDVVVWTAHPFSVYAKARLVFVDGALRYNSDAPQEPWSDFQLGQGGDER